MDETAPDISVCIANYNGEADLAACLDSVLAQLGKFRCEVVLHDDASTDASVALVRARYPSVHVVESSSNVGFCVSNNRMVKAAKGRYLLLLNNDALLRPGSLQRLFSFAKDGNPDSILGLPQHALADGSLVDRGYRTDPFLNPIPILSESTHEAGVATGACLWIPRQVWDAVGGFPPWFESVAEDIFLCVAARLLGYRVLVLDAPGFDHWIGKNLGGGKLVAQRLRTSVRRRSLSERNKTAVMLMCYPWPALVPLLPLHTALLATEALFLLATGTTSEKVCRIYGPIPQWLWSHRQDIHVWRKRLIQQRRTSAPTFFAQTRWFPEKLRMLLRHGKPSLY